MRSITQLFLIPGKWLVREFVSYFPGFQGTLLTHMQDIMQEEETYSRRKDWMKTGAANAGNMKKFETLRLVKSHYDHGIILSCLQ